MAARLVGKFGLWDPLGRVRSCGLLGLEMRWGRSKDDSTEAQQVNLRECVGIIYGPMTTTFQNCTAREDPDWSCFSLLFMGRTLDLSVSGDRQIHAWILGLQHLAFLHGVGSMPVMTGAQFYARKVQYKLTALAHQNGYVFSRYLIMKVKEAKESASRAASDPKPAGLKGLGPGALVSGGALAKPMQLLSPIDFKAKKDKKRDKNEEADSDAASRLLSLKTRVLQLQAALRERTAQADAGEAMLQKAAAGKLPSASEELQKELQQIALEVIQRRCKLLEAEAQRVTESNDQLAPEVKAADKSQRSLKKLQAKLEDREAAKLALEKELGTASACVKVQSERQKVSSQAEVQSQGRQKELQKRVQELEAELQGAQAKEHAEKAAEQNKKHDEAIAKAEQEKLHLSQRLEEVKLQHAQVLEAEKKAMQRLALRQKANESVETALAPLKALPQQLREEQTKLRAEVKEMGQTFVGEIAKMVDGTNKLKERAKSLEEKYKAALEDRKKLQDTVAELQVPSFDAVKSSQSDVLFGG
ncbi:LAMB1 [Symbiodinium natans]|uniref:LAMB1 protein n=1 Tax=Symbiodinium natans TaxID=878477 RepID=A0A812N3Q9_9DINO|nr:LAMB1 [Symbiodinium natans]